MPYVHGHSAAVQRSHGWRTAANSAAYLLPHLAPGQAVLDVGCGVGTITADLATLVAPGHVLGLDVAAAALATAAAVATERGVTVSWRQDDLLAAGLEAGAFDVVHAHQVLQHVPDPVALLREMRRVSRGLVAVREVDYAATRFWPEVPELSAWVELYRTVARAEGGEPDAGTRLGGWARAAGCTDVTTSTSGWLFADPEDRAWWGETWAERTTGPGLGAAALRHGLATEAELTTYAAAWRAWSAAPEGSCLMVHGELLSRG